MYCYYLIIGELSYRFTILKLKGVSLCPCQDYKGDEQSEDGLGCS